ncbi:MAG: hypothetical protein R2769_11665 [Saprospiraceae bacterium]
MKLGKSDLSGNGSIQNYLAYFSPEKTMEGNFDLKARQLDLNEWMTETPDNANSNRLIPVQVKYLIDSKSLKRVKADIVEYDTYKLLNTNLDGTVSADHIVIRDFSTNISQMILLQRRCQKRFNYLFENGNTSRRFESAKQLFQPK